MGQVYVTTYEIIGEAIPLIEAHNEAQDRTQAACFAVAEQFGATGYRPISHGRQPQSLFFDGELPTGWRKVGQQGGKVEARPNRSTKAGREALKVLNDVERAPEASELAGQLGYSPREMAMDTSRGIIYFPTTVSVVHPKTRHFIRIPRFDGDGFAPDDTKLTAIPESELMKALEDHNAEARGQNEQVPA